MKDNKESMTENYLHPLDKSPTQWISDKRTLGGPVSITILFSIHYLNIFNQTHIKTNYKILYGSPNILRLENCQNLFLKVTPAIKVIYSCYYCYINALKNGATINSERTFV